MFEMSAGQFGHPYVQQEVCVIERTMRQEPLGANLLNFGLQGQSIKSVRADVGNSLLALIPGSQHQVRTSFQPAAAPRSTFTSSSPQAYQMGSVSSGAGSWPVHLSTISAGNRVSSGGSGNGAEASTNMLGREAHLSMLGREVNLAQYSRMSAGQDCFESNSIRASGFDTLKQTDNGNDASGQGPFPQWLTGIVSRRQRVQNMQCPPTFPSGRTFPRGPESSREVRPGMNSGPPAASSTTRGARVVCTNYDTGQRIGGELYLTQLGLLGVLCCCHGSHMSVSKFTQHVGIYSTNPGNIVVMDVSGESLTDWRKMFFSQYGVKVPEDNQGWDWSEVDVCESGPPKYKAVVTQSWKKEVDVSYDGEPLLKSRVTQVWDTSVSPGPAANFHSTPNLANMGLQTNLAERAFDDSREGFLKSFGRAFRGNPVDFGSCPPPIENLQQNMGRSQGSVDIHARRSPSHLGATSSGEFFNFISGSQQFVSAHAEQHVALERQMGVGNRTLLKGLDLTWNDGEHLQQDKDNSLSSFELRLGQPSEQSQPVGGSLSSTLASQMQRVMHRVLDTRRQQDTQSMSASGLHTFPAHQGLLSERQSSQHQQSFERVTHMEPSQLNTLRVDPNRGAEGNGSLLVDSSSFKRIEDVSNYRLAEIVRERENMLSRDVGHFSVDGVRRWPVTGNVGRSFVPDGLLLTSDHPSKQWDNDVQHQLGGVWPLSQGQQDLDTILSQEWVSKNRCSQSQATQLADTVEGREGQGCHGENSVNPEDFTPASKGSLQAFKHEESRIKRPEISEGIGQVWRRADDQHSLGLECTASKANSAVAVSSGVSEKQQPISDVCSKSSENVLSGFSDDTGAEEEASNAQSNDKNHLRSEVVDEGSGIGKCSSSEGVDMGLVPNMSSKDGVMHKDASPSSQGCPSVSYAEEDLTAKVGTRSRRGYSMKEPLARHLEEDVIVDGGTVEKKRPRTMKWKRLDAAVDAGDAKRQKQPAPTLAGEVDAPQTQLSDSTNWKKNRNLTVEFSPSLCGPVKTRKLLMAPSIHATLPEELEVGSNVAHSVGVLEPQESFLKRPDTVVIRVAQSMSYKKAKRSGRSNFDRRKTTAGLSRETADDSEMVNVETRIVASSSIKESGVTGTVIPESALPSATLLPKSLSTLNVQPLKVGRVMLGRPSPRNGTRMVSLNEIMSKPEVLTVAFSRDCLEPTSAEGGLKVSTPKESLKATESTSTLKTSVDKGRLKVSSLSKVPVVKSGLRPAAPNEILNAAAFKETSKDPVLPVSDNALYFKDGFNTRGSNESRLKSPITVGPVNVPFKSSTEGVKASSLCKASLLKNGLKRVALKGRLKQSSCKDTTRDISLDITNVSALLDGPHTPILKDGLKSAVTVDGFLVPSGTSREGKGPRKMDSRVSPVPIDHNQDKEASLAVKTWKEPSNVNKSHKHEVRKVRSLYELTAEQELPGPGAGVFEVQQEIIDSPQVIKQDVCAKMSMKSEQAYSVPVRFSESKCFVPRGERSPRGKLPKIKNIFWQKGRDRPVGLSKLAIEPIEIVVGRRFVEDPVHKADIAMAGQTEVLTAKRGCPMVTPLGFPQKFNNKSAGYDGAPISSHIQSSMVVVKDLFKEDTFGSNRSPPHKRVAEQLDRLGSTFKKPKLLRTFGTVGSSSTLPRIRTSEPSSSLLKFRQPEPYSGLLKVRHPVPTLTSSVPTPLLSSQIGLSDLNGTQINCQTTEDDVKAGVRKKRCQRPKWLDCRVPEGLVECCVCGSSISEFFNQIVCCARCPVKVHQACYGVKKIPNCAWLCRTCKATATHPICVLCGYGGGAMTRAQKATGFLKGLVRTWQEKANAKDRTEDFATHSQDLHGNEGLEHCIKRNQEAKGVSSRSELTLTLAGHLCREHEKPESEGGWMACNTVTLGVVDPTAVQWVHMVCALWMPGTRCLNFGTMGVFDVSGVAQPRRRLICSICNRKGGACIQCRVMKCGIPFHAWCAHEKGLLQSEIVDDGSDQVGFYGKCLRHGKDVDLPKDTTDFANTASQVSGSVVVTSTCARSEGYKGKLTLEQRALYRRQAARSGSAAVSPEQVAAWLRINERKTFKPRRVLKSTSSDPKTDHREYLRFKQEQCGRRLSVYKSGIHALGLYTSEFIGRDEMVVEYIGEIVGLRVADKREADYHSGKRMQYQGACYLFRIDKERIIDATRKGGIARFVNHSCSPNCVAKVICVRNQSKVVFFAQRDIYAGEEITYDYQFNFEQEGDKIPCFCGSANCRGTLN